MELNEAVASGAIAFFGEKYAQQVRVVSIPNVSMELCGGTHTKHHRRCWLVQDRWVSRVSLPGIRRIEALTGFGTYNRLEEDEDIITDISHTLRAPRGEITRAIQRLIEAQRDLEANSKLVKRKSARSQLDGLLEAAQSVKGVSVLSRKVDGMDASMLRELAETAGAKIGSGVVVLGLASNGKASLVAVVSEDLQKACMPARS